MPANLPKDLPNESDLRGMRAVVMGLGQFGGGVAAASYLARSGADVCVTDLRTKSQLERSCAALDDLPIRFELGTHLEQDFRTAQLVVVNPAVSPSNALLQTARSQGACITSEMELFLHGTKAQVLLVSGTHGKSSTVTFLYQLLRGWKRPVFLGGNLGRPLLDVPEAWSSDATCVVEISSYQLDALHAQDLAPKVQAAGLTALAPDHLERHGTEAAYLAAKARVFEMCTPGALAMLPKTHWEHACFVQAREKIQSAQWLSYGQGAEHHWKGDTFFLGGSTVTPSRPWKVVGDFQKDNALLALSLAHSIGMPLDIAAARLPHLTGLPHRLHRLALTEPDSQALLPAVFDNGVSTTPESTLAALASLPSPLVLLVGGQAKRGLAYEALARACAKRGDHVHLFGAAQADLSQTFVSAQCKVTLHYDLAAAVQAALEGLGAGHTLLFSPACASFDAYPNFQARALEFAEHIEGWARRITSSE